MKGRPRDGCAIHQNEKRENFSSPVTHVKHCEYSTTNLQYTNLHFMLLVVIFYFTVEHCVHYALQMYHSILVHFYSTIAI